MAINLGSAYVDIVPSTSGLAGKIKRDLELPLAQSGQASGNSFSEGFASRVRGRIGSAISSVASTVGDALSTGLKVAGATGAASLGAALYSGFQRLTTIQDASAALTISLGSSTEAAQLLADVLAVVKGTPFNLDQFAAAAQQMVGFGIDAQKVPGYLTAIGEASATQGKRAGEFADRLSTVFGQIAATGQLDLGSVWQISETGVNALAILANGFGVTREEMKNMISDGAVPAGKALDALADGILNGSDGAAGATVALKGTMASLRQTLSGAEGGFKAGVARFGAALIGPFVPALTRGFTEVTAVLDDLGPRISAGLERIVNSPGAKAIAAWLGDLPAKLGPAFDLLAGLGPAVAPLAEGIARFGSSLADTVGATIEHLATGIAPALPGIAEGIGDLGHALGDIADGLKPVLTGVVDFGAALVRNLGPGLVKGVADALGVVATVLHDLAPILPTVAGLVLALVVGFKAYHAALLIATAAQAAFNIVMGANPLVLVAGLLVALGIALYEAYKHFGPFHDAVDKVWQIMQTVFHWVADNWPLLLAILTGPIGLAVKLIADHWETIKSGVTAVKDWIVDRWNDVIGFIQGIPATIAAIGSTLWDGIGDGLESIANWILARFGDLVNGIIDIINIAIGAYNAIPLAPNIDEIDEYVPPQLGGSSATPKSLADYLAPYRGFASGAYVTGPTLGVFGEAGDEAVLPIDQIQPRIDAAVAKAAYQAPTPAPAVVLQVDTSGADRDIASLIARLVDTDPALRSAVIGART